MDGPKKQSANMSSRLMDRVVPSSTAFVEVPKSGGWLSSPLAALAEEDELLLAPSIINWAISTAAGGVRADIARGRT